MRSSCCQFLPGILECCIQLNIKWLFERFFENFTRSCKIEIVCLVVIRNKFNKLKDVCCFGWFCTSDTCSTVALENAFVLFTFPFVVVLPRLNLISFFVDQGFCQVDLNYILFWFNFQYRSKDSWIELI